MKKAITGLSAKASTGLLAIALGLALASCGGGGDESTPQTVSGSITGVAATGAAISGGIVTLKCAGGLSSATTTTTANGSYNFMVDKVTLPCLAQVSYSTPGGTQSLHTYISSIGNSNITPLTELLLAQLRGETPIYVFTHFGSSPSNNYKAEDISTALAALKTKLLSAGISLPDNIDPVHAVLIAKTDTQYGNTHDAALDKLAADLQGLGITLNRLILLVSHGLAVDDDIAVALAQDVEEHDMQGIHNGFLNGTETPCTFSIDGAGNILPQYLPVYPSQILTIPSTPVADAMGPNGSYITPIVTLNKNNVELSHTEFTGLATYTARTNTLYAPIFTHEWHYLKPSAPGAFNTSDDFNANKSGYSATLRKVSNAASMSPDSPVGGLFIPHPEAHIELEISGLNIPTSFSFPALPIPLTCVGNSYNI